MLNRTNRTLSANSNRLNLGTRSLVLANGLNNGNSTLRVRLAHEDSMRDGMFLGRDPLSESRPRISIQSIPGSTPVVPWPVAGPGTRLTVGGPATSPGVRSVQPSYQGCDDPAAQGQTQKKHKALEVKRFHLGRSFGGRRATAAATTTPAAAITAAAGG